MSGPSASPVSSPRIVLDAHQDIALNALSLGRDYLMNAAEKRVHEAGTPLAAKEGLPLLGLPDALRGRVAVVFATIFTMPNRPNALGITPDASAYRTPQEAYRSGMAQLDYYRRLFDRMPRIRLIERQGDLDAVLATWNGSVPQQGFVLLMENADPILEPKQFEDWYAYGVRIVGPAWTSTRYCGGTGEPGGLTALGRELLEVMASFHAVLDLSHMAEQAFFEALDQYTGAVIASHSNPRRFRNTDRHLSDAMIRRLAERDGVMGIVPYNRFLSEAWRPGEPKAAVPLLRVVDAIDHVCQVTGSAAHVGIGSDFDGGFGAASVPEGIDTIGDLIGLAGPFQERGYAEAEIDAILSGNFLRVLRRALPA